MGKIRGSNRPRARAERTARNGSRPNPHQERLGIAFARPRRDGSRGRSSWLGAGRAVAGVGGPASAGRGIPAERGAVSGPLLDLLGDPIPEPPPKPTGRGRKERPAWTVECLAAHDMLSRPAITERVEMATFDSLPPALRRLLDEAGCQTCAWSVARAVAAGTGGVP